MKIKEDPGTTQLFASSITVTLGDGQSALFWVDKWISGHSIEDLSPNLFQAVQIRARNSLLVAEAMTNRRWVCDITGALTV